MDSPYLMVYDPQRAQFFRDQPFKLDVNQLNHIINGRLASSLCSGVDLDVYKAFNNPISRFCLMRAE